MLCIVLLLYSQLAMIGVIESVNEIHFKVKSS